MEFRAQKVADEQNAQARKYLTGRLTEPEAGQETFDKLLSDLGNVVDGYPDWHPLLTAPPNSSADHVLSLEDVAAYRGMDHTVRFVRGFVTCPYSVAKANKIVNAVGKVPGLAVHQLEAPLYADNACAVVVTAHTIELEADGTICGRDAIRLFAEQAVKEMQTAEVAETWWNVRSLILGRPHGSRSSLFVNQHAGLHMRKILEALNNSGVYGSIKEVSLEMLSQNKRNKIAETLLQAAVNAWDGSDGEFDFELCGETCRASIRDIWEDGEEMSVRIEIGDFDLYVTGFYYPKDKRFTFQDPRGKRALAEKFC